jgi:hypothetical protein
MMPTTEPSIYGRQIHQVGEEGRRENVRSTCAYEKSPSTFPANGEERHHYGVRDFEQSLSRGCYIHLAKPRLLRCVWT